MLTEQEVTTEKVVNKPIDSKPAPAKVEEEFWDDLMAHIEEGNVIPVLGPELLTIEYNGEKKSFYRLVAEELLTSFKLSVAEMDSRKIVPNSCHSEPIVLRRGFELMDAVCAIHNQKDKPLDDFHVAVNNIIKQLMQKYQHNLPRALCNLAAIEPLSLFVTTTCDNMLASAINEVRQDKHTKVCEVEYAPNLSSDRQCDIPEDWNKNQAAVFYLFGKTSASQSNAIHEEDMLEWIYNLQKDPEAGLENLLKLVRGKHLLFIGCSFNDWLGRFLVRTSNSKRLLDRRENFEFMVFDPACMDMGLTLFLERFSKNSKLCYASSEAFVDELLSRWKDIQPKTNPKNLSEHDTQLYTNFRKSKKGAIFISYASQDHAAAQHLCNQLKNIAGEEDIAWLDKDGGLEGGDDWEHVIHRTISKDCQLFIALISSNTQLRNEGVFRKEWGWAVERDSGIFGKKFILPLFIDSKVTNIPNEQLLVNPRFTELHIEQAIDGTLSEELVTLMKNRVREIRQGYTK